jgi:riboflavin kinase/FMN adenylyltransferase
VFCGRGLGVVIGEVVVGEQRGRTIGFPTANISLGREGASNGVFAGLVTLPDASRHPAAINIGFRPSFGDNDDRRLEAHLLGFDGDLYGQVIMVDLIEKLRDERRLPSVEALIAQLRVDVDRAREILVGHCSQRRRDAGGEAGPDGLYRNGRRDRGSAEPR